MNKFLSIIAFIFLTNFAFGQTEKVVQKLQNFPELVDNFIAHQNKEDTFYIYSKPMTVQKKPC